MLESTAETSRERYGAVAPVPLLFAPVAAGEGA